MIRYISQELEPLFLQLVDSLDIFSVKIFSQFQTYGLRDGTLDLWMSFNEETPTGLISKLDGNMTVSVSDAVDIAELAMFLPAVGGSAVEGMLPVLERLNTVLCGTAESSWVMCGSSCCGQEQPVREKISIEKSQRLGDVYELLCKCDPLLKNSLPYDAWLVETSHKLRHNLADNYILKVNQDIISTASIQFKSKTRALLAAVATEPAHQGKGFARELMRHVTMQAFSQGLVPYLLTSNDALANFYKLCGYTADGRWGRIALPMRTND